MPINQLAIGAHRKREHNIMETETINQIIEMGPTHTIRLIAEKLSIGTGIVRYYLDKHRIKWERKRRIKHSFKKAVKPKQKFPVQQVEEFLSDYFKCELRINSCSMFARERKIRGIMLCTIHKYSDLPSKLMVFSNYAIPDNTAYDAIEYAKTKAAKELDFVHRLFEEKFCPTLNNILKPGE